MLSQQLLITPQPPKLKLGAPNELNPHDSDFYCHPHLTPGQDPLKGRLLRVSKPVKEGTVLLVDTSYAIVPVVEENSSHALICSNLACSRQVVRDSQSQHCSRNCFNQVAWCNEACRIADQDRHEFECMWLKKHAETMLHKETHYDFITLWHIVRILAGRHLETSNKASIPASQYPWETKFKRNWEAFEGCCAYLDSWPEPQLVHWKRLIASYLSDASLLPGLPSSDDVLTILCREETNTFGLYPKLTGPLYMPDRPVARGECYGVSVFPRAAMFNHSCAPNVTHKPDSQGRMVYTAARDISKDEECLITYFDLTQKLDIRERKEWVEEQFRFSCTCDRCLEEDAEENMAGVESLPFGLF